MTLRCLLLASVVAAVVTGCGKPSQQAVAPMVAPTELAALRTPPPDYPPQLACAGIGGKAVLKVVVGPQGTPIEVSLMQSSGQPELDNSAQTRLHDWKFKAATRNSQPVAQTIQVPVDFKPPVLKPAECFVIEERARRRVSSPDDPATPPVPAPKVH